MVLRWSKRAQEGWIDVSSFLMHWWHGLLLIWSLDGKAEEMGFMWEAAEILQLLEETVAFVNRYERCTWSCIVIHLYI